MSGPLLWLLPPARRDWGRAMLAEHAALEAGRTRFALGCARAILPSFAGLACALVFAAALLAAAPRLTTVAIVAVLAVIVGAARQAGVTDRRARSAGYAAAGAGLLLLATGPGGHSDPNGWWIVGLVFALCFGGVAQLTRTRARVDVLPAALGALVWTAALMSSPAIRERPQLALAVVGAAALATAFRRGAHGAFVGAFATCLVLFAATLGVYRAAPQLAPNVVPANAINPRLENQIESTDPYVEVLLLAALLAVPLLVTRRDLSTFA